MDPKPTWSWSSMTRRIPDITRVAGKPRLSSGQESKILMTRGIEFTPTTTSQSDNGGHIVDRRREATTSKPTRSQQRCCLRSDADVKPPPRRLLTRNLCPPLMTPGNSSTGILGKIKQENTKTPD